jgi:predicted transcriptional regulator of viral defense system
VAFFGDLAALAQRQHGTITRAQALAIEGGTDGQLATLVRNGVLVRHLPGLYVVSGMPDTWHRRLQLALHVGGPLAVVSHRASAGLWRLDRYRPGRVEVLSPHLGARTGDRAVVHRSIDLPERDREVVHGFPVTSVTRTLVDMGRYVGVDRLGKMIDDAVVRGLTSYEEVGQRASELSRSGRNGVVTVREAMSTRPSGAPAPGSPLEVDVRRLLVDHGLPDPVPQFAIECGELTYQLDLAWPGPLVAVECDGFRFHRTPEQLDWDDRRRTELSLRGWMVLHATWNLVRNDPMRLVTDVRRALESRGAL